MASSNTVFMYPDKVKAIAQGLDATAKILQGISAVLYAQMMILKATAFVGLVGGLAVERYLSTIKQQVDQYAKRCSELSTEVNSAVQRYLGL